MKAAEPTHQFFKTWDGYELYYQSWIPEKKRGALVVLHGLGEHSGRYRFFIDYFLDQGWALYLMDQRGHGKSPGPRSHADRFQDLVDDLERFVGLIREREAKQPLFLVAHSFGGQVGVNYLARKPKELKGAVLSGPNLKLALPVPALKKILGTAASRFLPEVLIPNDIHASWVSHDEAVVRAYEEDPLVARKISLKLGAEILKNLDEVMALAPEIRTPLLIVHGGDDKITATEGSREFFERLDLKDKQLKVYPGYFHETFNEVGKEKVFRDIEQWLEARLHK